MVEIDVYKLTSLYEEFLKNLDSAIQEKYSVTEDLFQIEEEVLNILRVL